ncbi:MAG: DUF4876 domain-containing protein [Bacteroidales bacterium]|nr:DUF4876 domain-containing protein [Bacteroidales bacterium]
MKRIIYILTLVMLLGGCAELPSDNLYEGSLHELRIQVSYPEGYREFKRSGVIVRIENISVGVSYSLTTDDGGIVEAELASGLYRVSVMDRTEEHIFNGAVDNIRLAGRQVSVTVDLIRSKPGALVIKELYTGGCKKLPIEGDYQSDKYAILHNNSAETLYLDSLCFGTADPYNSNATNVWVTQDPSTGESIFKDFVPVIQCIWQFPGTGQSFPLAPGEDAVIAMNGAIDHTALYPLSVNLNNEEYFVCYNSTYFPNTIYHPAPGDRIRQERILDVVIKTGQANAYPISISSPTFVIFRPEDITIQDYILQPDVVIPKPGSGKDYIVCIPQDWILDGLEAFDGRSVTNLKRLGPAIDAGYVSLVDTYLGNSYLRRTDEEATRMAGYEVLVDTNNSSNDFFLSEKATLYRPADE